MDSDVKTDKVWLLSVQKKLYQLSTPWFMESWMHSKRCMSGSERGYRKPMTEKSHGACNLLLPLKPKAKDFCTDQGSQFISKDFTNTLLVSGVKIIFDGKCKAMDNIFTERLWRSLKYEEVYINDYQTVRDARNGIAYYFNLYSNERPHQSLNYMTPYEVYFEKVRH